MEEKMQLQELKKEYDAKLLSKRSYKELLKKRDEIYDQAVRLKDENITRKLREIDHQLDEIDEHDNEKLDQLKESLVQLILQTYPESQNSYQKLYQKRATSRKDEIRYCDLYGRLASFYGALREGAQAKKSRGFLGFLFGRNSKVVLARAIRKAVIEAQRIYDYVDDEAIRKFLDVFLEEANRSWNSALYREQFHELYDEFCRILKNIEEKRTQSKSDFLKTEKEIDTWIEKYCGN